MDYICTEATRSLFNGVSPSEIEDNVQLLYEEVDSSLFPIGYKVIRSEANDTRYIIVLSDLIESSPLLEVEEDQLMTIEHFENGLPSWLGVKPGTRYYLAEWTGSEWHFEKVAGI